MLFSRKTSVLAKLETTYGIDSVPTGSANAILVSNVSLSPQDVDSVDRNLYYPYLGASPQLVVGQKVMLDFDVEIAGAGTSAVTKAAFDPLLQACGFASTINTSISVDYTPVSTGFKSLSLYCFIDGIKHSMVGAMGTVSFELAEKKIPVMKFKFTGMYAAPTDSSNPTAVFTQWQIPQGVNNTNTSAFTLHGYSGILQSLTIDMNNTITHHNWVGSENITITDRKPSGSITMQMPDTLAAKDWFAEALAMTLGTLTLTHGTAAFNTFKVDCPASVQLIKPTYGDADGVRTLQASLAFIPTSAGNDEVKFSTL